MCVDHAVHISGRDDAWDGGHLSEDAIHATMTDKHDSRRRSVDIGGLALALGTWMLGEDGMGKGWGGWDENEDAGTPYAELLNDMYTHTQSAVNTPFFPPLPAVPQDTRHQLINALDNWHFEPHKLLEDEVLACTQILFEVLYRVQGMQETVGVSLEQLNAFLLHLRQAYRSSNSYHNFQHALDVFQATHVYLRLAGVVPPVSILLSDDGAKRWKADAATVNPIVGLLRNEDLFALCIAAVGHDVGHPGLNNMFMKNAQTPLSQVYDHKSALEQMHCAFLLPIMKRYGLAHLLDRGKAGVQFRKLLLETVLATDMGVHAKFMENFRRLIDHPELFDDSQRRILVCQALIKCADISNPSRPHCVSQHWSAALAAEWANQASLERQLHLPVSVQDTDDPVLEAKGQVSFIQLFCLPLLTITSIPIPEMKCFAEQCATNCSLWKARITTSQASNYPPVPYRPTSPPQQHDFLSVFPLSLPSHLLFQQPPFDERYLDFNGLASVNGKANKNGFSSSIPSFAPVFDRATPSAPSDYGSRSPSPSLTHSASNSVNSVSSSTPSESRTAQQTSRAPLPSITIETTNGSATSSSVLSPVESCSSSSVSPRSEHVPRTPSISGSINGGAAVNGALEPNANASIRAAYKLQSIRKKKSFHRNSWTPGASTLSTYPAFTMPLPPSPSPSPLAGRAASPRQM